LKTHRLIHSGQKNHVCDVCSKKFGTATHLKTHKLIHSDRKHVCDVCNKACTYLCNLKKHKLIHTRQKGDSTQESVSPSPQ
jgi:KRAB domain-containing zinc finger protein